MLCFKFSMVMINATSSHSPRSLITEIIRKTSQGAGLLERYPHHSISEFWCLCIITISFCSTSFNGVCFVWETKYALHQGQSYAYLIVGDGWWMMDDGWWWWFASLFFHFTHAMLNYWFRVQLRWLSTTYHHNLNNGRLGSLCRVLMRKTTAPPPTTTMTTTTTVASTSIHQLCSNWYPCTVMHQNCFPRFLKKPMWKVVFWVILWFNFSLIAIHYPRHAWWRWKQPSNIV